VINDIRMDGNHFVFINPEIHACPKPKV